MRLAMTAFHKIADTLKYYARKDQRTEVGHQVDSAAAWAPYSARRVGLCLWATTAVHGGAGGATPVAQSGGCGSEGFTWARFGCDTSVHAVEIPTCRVYDSACGCESHPLHD